MHFKYWEKYIKRAWENHGIFRKPEGAWITQEGTSSGTLSSLNEWWDQSFRDLGSALQQ